MNENWKAYPGAPRVGTAICAAHDVPANGTLGLDMDGFPLLLVRHGNRLLAYVNACPHQFLPLDYRSSSVLSADGRTLRCSNHQAGFDIATGAGIDGLGAGCALDPVPVHLDNRGIVIVGRAGCADEA